MTPDFRYSKTRRRDSVLQKDTVTSGSLCDEDIKARALRVMCVRDAMTGGCRVRIRTEWMARLQAVSGNKLQRADTRFPICWQHVT